MDPASTGYLSVGQDSGQTGQGPHGAGSPRFPHSFAPGIYHVTASGEDTEGDKVSWTSRSGCSRGCA